MIIEQVKWSASGEQLHNFIRGLDSSPGAWTSVSLVDPAGSESVEWQEIRLYGAQRFKSDAIPSGRAVFFEGCERSGVITDQGMLIPGSDGKWVTIIKINIKFFLTIFKTPPRLLQNSSKTPPKLLQNPLKILQKPSENPRKSQLNFNTIPNKLWRLKENVQFYNDR